MIGTGFYGHPQPEATGERILLPAVLQPRGERQQGSELVIELFRREGAASRRAAAQQPTCRQQLLISLQQGLLQSGLALRGGCDARPAVQ